MTTVETDPPVGRRERKKAATRAALSEAAMRLSLEHGVENVTVEQITDDADIALRTFFNYFSSKEEAVVAGDAGRGDRLVADLRERPASESVLTALHAAVVTYLEDLAGDARFEALLMLRRSPSLLPHQLAAFAARERALAAVIADRVGGDRASGLYPTMVAATVMANLRVVTQRWVESSRDPEDTAALRGAAETIFDLLAGGLDDR